MELLKTGFPEEEKNLLDATKKVKCQSNKKTQIKLPILPSL
jgi:hypothetical protein